MASGANYSGLGALDFAYYLDKGYVLRSRRNPAGTESEGELMIYRDDKPGQYLPLPFRAKNHVVEPVGQVFVEVLNSTAASLRGRPSLERVRSFDVLSKEGLSNEEVRHYRYFRPRSFYVPRHGNSVEFAIGEYNFSLWPHADHAERELRAQQEYQEQRRRRVQETERTEGFQVSSADYLLGIGIGLVYAGLLARQAPRLPLVRHVLATANVRVAPAPLAERRFLAASTALLLALGAVAAFKALHNPAL